MTQHEGLKRPLDFQDAEAASEDEDSGKRKKPAADAEEITSGKEDPCMLHACVLGYVSLNFLCRSHGAIQEYATFKKFGDSLLSRCSKMADLVSEVEEYQDYIKKDSCDAKRASKHLASMYMHDAWYKQHVDMCFVCSAQVP